MAPKLYIFAIGGTGTRIIKALTMLSAAGIPLNVSAIVPIIIDPHKKNGDFLRTQKLLEKYQAIRAKSKPEAGEFFGTLMAELQRIDLEIKNDDTFSDYIKYHDLDDANKALANLLYTEQNLGTEMSFGFIGHPNIGSVVLNQIGESPAFREFAANFSPGDRIFIISSIFGGTGAAGFPLLLKNIRGAAEEETDSKLERSEYLKQAKIGALTVLPYFGLEEEKKKSEKEHTEDERIINPRTFIGKTKAALHYYTRGVNKAVNRLYYIGDESTKNYAYDPGNGEKEQENQAHLIELISALAIVDFANLQDDELKTDTNGNPVNPSYYGFGLNEDPGEEPVTFRHLGETIRSIIARPLSRMALFSIYLQEHLSQAVEKVAWAREKPVISSSFLQEPFVREHLAEFNTAFRHWLQEMADNKRSFQPFAIDDSFELVADPTELLKGYGAVVTSEIRGETDSGGSFFSRWTKNLVNPLLNTINESGKGNFNEIDSQLNAYSSKHKIITAEEKLLKVTAHGLDKLLTERFPSLFKSIPTTLKS